MFVVRIFRRKLDVMNSTKCALHGVLDEPRVLIKIGQAGCYLNGRVRVLCKSQ
jgi:hypothetical protein